jgi:hypothetical protein
MLSHQLLLGDARVRAARGDTPMAPAHERAHTCLCWSHLLAGLPSLTAVLLESSTSTGARGVERWGVNDLPLIGGWCST